MAHRGLRGSHHATQDRAIIDHDATGFYVTHEFTGAPDVHALAGLQRANHVATNDYFRSLNLRFDASVWAACESPTGDANFSFELAIQEQITLTRDLSFDLDTLTHSNWRARESCGAAVPGCCSEETEEGKAPEEDSSLLPCALRHHIEKLAEESDST